MKLIKKIAAMFTVICIAMSCFCLPVSASAVNDAANGVVYIETPGVGAGTGFCVGKTGENPEYVVTNAHVVADLKTGEVGSPLVVFSGMANKYMVPEIYYIDTVVDICVLKLPEPTTERKPLTFCSSDDIDIGDTVYALGYPDYGSVGQNYETMDVSDITLTKGIVSKKTRVNWSSTVGLDAILSDVQISAGNSGGPMVNEDGAVIGINTSVTNENASETANGAFAMTTKHIFAALNAAGAPYEMYSDAEQADVEAAVPTESPTESGENDNNGMVIAVIAIAAAVVVIIVVIIVLGRKKKSTAAPVKKSDSSEAVVVGSGGAFNGKKFNVGSGIIIGRNPEKCTICYAVNTKGISGVHCEIRKNGNAYEIIDCGSSYGTFLGNGQKLVPNVPVELTNGTYFYLGSTEQMFQFKLD